MRTKTSKHVSRREAVGGLLALGGSLWVGCSEGNGKAAEPMADAGGASEPGGEAGTDATTSGANRDSGGGQDSRWASGGTAVMTGDYPDPFAGAMPAACALLARLTPGPCTEEADRTRRDISEGYPGIPVRLALRIVDTECKALSGVKVKVWHTSNAGGYSGDTPSAACLRVAGDDSKHYFRGVQTTDANGRVDFDTCFPGWYPGRAVHIHFTLSRDAASFTSQLAFDQALVDEIFASHGDYQSYGAPDTTNAKDGILGGANLQSFVLETTRLDDGAMMAVKEMVLETA